MQKNLINSQLNNFRTYELKKRRLLTIAENVFLIKNLPLYIDVAYINRKLVRAGAIAWFYDDELGLLALPYTNIGNLDVYGRPKKIMVESFTGYRRTLNEDEFVIMWDNTGHYPIWLDILQFSERLAQCERTADINIAQQKTPRFWKTNSDKLESIKKMVNNVDGYENTVISYDGIDINDTNIVLSPAPFVADKIDEHKEKIWNEFLCLVGIANMNFQKKERNISDEITASQGGTIASRFSRYSTRKEAIDKINSKWGEKGINLELEYYDGLPTTMVENIENEDFELEDVEDEDRGDV